MSDKMRPVCVIGSGPAGLLAAHAVCQAGLPLVIVSDGKRSRLGGAQFLHAPIPGITQAARPDTTVVYQRRGDPEVYRRKAFGSLKVDWKPWTEGGQPEARHAWSLDWTYGKLWDLFESTIQFGNNKVHVDHEWLEKVQGEFSMIVSTVPLASLCQEPDRHQFVNQLVRIVAEPYEDLPDDTVLYDGTQEKSWYRTSRIFNTCFTEWGQDAKTPPGVNDLITDYKPMSTTCTCLDKYDRLIKVGRRGKWDAREFSHGAYYDTMMVIGAMYGR